MHNQLDRRRFIAGVGVSALGSSALIPLAEAKPKEDIAMNVINHSFHETEREGFNAGDGEYAIDRVSRLMCELSHALNDYQQECELAGTRATCNEARVRPAVDGAPVCMLVNPRALEEQVSPELDQLIAAETRAKASVDQYAPIHRSADKDHIERLKLAEDRGSFKDVTFEPIEAEWSARNDAWWDSQLEVLAFPTVEKADVVAKAAWIARRYPNPAEFMSMEAEAIWSAFMTIADAAA